MTFNIQQKHALFVFLSLLIIFSGCGKKKTSTTKTKQAKAKEIQIDTALSHRLDEFAKMPKPSGKFGFYVYDLTAGKSVYAFKEHDAMPSASCMKLLTGIAGINLLGPRYTYNTITSVSGSTSNGTLNGDIFFKGGMDPLFNEDDIKEHAKSIKQKGIKNITGKVYISLAMREPVKAEPHWYPWDLSFHNYGLFYKGEDKVRQALKTAMKAQGIAVTDSQLVLERKDNAKAKNICMTIHPMTDVINKMWKNSSNTQATSLLYTIGHHINKLSDHPENVGVKYLRYFIKRKIGVKDTNIVIHDGCGLCTENHLSPYALVKMLSYGYRHQYMYKIMKNELSISGIDGTVKALLRNEKLRGRIHAKTGTLSHPYGISSLAGYCKAANGHTLAFAIMGSDMSVLDTRELEKKLCMLMIK